MVDRGFSLLELVAALALSVIIVGIGILNFTKLEDPSKNGAAELSSYFKQIRARAISSTGSYRVRPTSATTIVGEYANACTATTFTVDRRLNFKMPTATNLLLTNWTICFNSRGYPDANLDVQLRDTSGVLKTVEVMLGGRNAYPMRSRETSSGFTLIEVLVAMTIFAIVSAMMAPSFTYHLKRNEDSEVRSGAMAAAQQTLDEIRLQSITSLPSSSSTTQSLNAGERTYSVATAYCNDNSFCSSTAREIEVTVSYKGTNVYFVQTVFAQLR